MCRLLFFILIALISFSAVATQGEDFVKEKLVAARELGKCEAYSDLIKYQSVAKKPDGDIFIVDFLDNQSYQLKIFNTDVMTECISVMAKNLDILQLIRNERPPISKKN